MSYNLGDLRHIKMAKKKKPSQSQQRNLRTQQIIFGIIAVILILSWIIGLVAR